MPGCGLETLLEHNKISLDDAATQYTQFLRNHEAVPAQQYFLRCINKMNSGHGGFKHEGTSSLTKWRAWGLRPLVLFAAAYIIVGILHELTHAVFAYLFRIPFTLLHFAVNLNRAHGTLNQLAVIGVAGPLFALGIGLLSWSAYTRTRHSRLGLPLLYFVMFGVGTFFGNLISTAFVGDFSRLALTLQLPMAVRYSASVLGVLLLCGLSFMIGMELRRWTPVGVGAAKAMIGMVALPAILGTAIALLIFLPIPSAFAYARIAESSFWIAAAVGTGVSRKQPTGSRQKLALGWADVALLFAAALLVRLMAGGISFVPSV